MIISHSIFDCGHIKAVPVIASFSNSGEIEPLHVRIDGEAYKIYNYNVKKSSMYQICYECQVMVCDRLKLLYLMYQVNEHAWFQVEKY